MMGLLLFARSRHWPVGVGVAAACAILILFCGPIGYSLNPDAGFRVAVAAQVPLLSALFTQASLGRAAASAESHPVRSLRRLRFAHVTVMTFTHCLVLGFAATSIIPPTDGLVNGFAELGPVAIVRNVLALTGVAFLSAAVFGVSFGWLLPLAWATLPYLMIPSLEADTSGVATLLMQPDREFTAFAVAVGCWLIGASSASLTWSLGGRPVIAQSRRPRLASSN